MRKIAFFILIIFAGIFSVKSQTGTIKVKISEYRNTKGELMVALFSEKNKSSFTQKIENAFEKKMIKISGNIVEINFENIPYGVYAVSIFHDENENLKMDRNSIGMPIEEYGVSNNVFFMGPPQFEPCKFELNTSKKVLEIKMKSVL
jgi:uncharacterized protein (DUF2141 family)